MTVRTALAAAAIGWLCWGAGELCNAQTPPANLSPDLQEVVRLSQQKMSDEVITNYIRNSGKAYKLGADDIIYLSSQGVSQGVLGVLLQALPPAALRRVKPRRQHKPDPSPRRPPLPGPVPPPLDAPAPTPSPAPAPTPRLPRRRIRPQAWRPPWSWPRPACRTISLPKAL